MASRRPGAVGVAFCGGLIVIFTPPGSFSLGFACTRSRPMSYTSVLPRISLRPSDSQALPVRRTVAALTSYSIEPALPRATCACSLSCCSNSAGEPLIDARAMVLSLNETMASSDCSRPPGTSIFTSPCRRHSELSNSRPVALACCAVTSSPPWVIFTRLNSSVLFL